MRKGLREYDAKRNFSVTPEPSGRKPRTGAPGPVFVVQKHDASHLHYDFRLEVEGVLVSWAIPKGPSINPADKRLAIMTEDHPLDYADFEGVIPEGEYGAGTVLLWDNGHYRNLKEKAGAEVPMAECVAQGHITVWLEGKKLKGGYSLTRFRREGGKEQWLLVKMKDDEAAPGRDIVKEGPRSVLSGKTIAQIS